MILFYTDESGTGIGDKRTPFFLLAGVAVSTTDSSYLDQRVRELKRGLPPWAEPEDFEIKGRDMRRGEKFFSGLNWAERAKGILEVADLIAELPYRILAVQVDKRYLTDYIRSDDQLYRLAFTRLLGELQFRKPCHPGSISTISA